MRRWLAIWLVAALAACSWVESPPLVSSRPVSDPPAVQAFAAGARAAFKALKLTGNPEVSPLRRALLIAPADWIACLRSALPPSPPFAIFFNGDKLVDYRPAVVIDNCDRESFAPLSVAPPKP